MRQPWRCFHCGTMIYTAGTDVCPSCDKCPYLRPCDNRPKLTLAEKETWKNIDSLKKPPMIIQIIIHRGLLND